MTIRRWTLSRRIMFGRFFAIAAEQADGDSGSGYWRVGLAGPRCARKSALAVPLELHDEIECRAAVENASDSRAGKAGLDRVRHIPPREDRSGQWRRGSGPSARTDVHLLFERQIDNTGNRPGCIAHMLSRRRRGGIVAEDL